MKTILALLAVGAATLAPLPSQANAFGWRSASCSFYMNGRLLSQEPKPCLAMFGATQVTAITYQAGETDRTSSGKTIRPGVDGWFGRAMGHFGCLGRANGYSVCASPN